MSTERNALALAVVSAGEAADANKAAAAANAMASAQLGALAAALAGIAHLKGKDGEDGEDGDDGLSAYQLWLAAGHEGDEAAFLAWIRGKNGASAYETWRALGNQGTEADFIASLRGRRGKTGPRGPKGDSIKGDKGDSIKGDRGPPGTLADTWRGDWRPGRYKKGDAVAHNGSSFVAERDTEREPSPVSPDWGVLALRGEDGEDGETRIIRMGGGGGGSGGGSLSGEQYENLLARLQDLEEAQGIALEITNAAPNGVIGDPYEHTYTRANGTAPFTWSAEGLPDGWELSEDGVLTATLDTETTYTFTVAVTDDYGRTATLDESVDVYLIPPIKVDLAEWWDLAEASGNRVGNHAGVVLTQFGGVSSGLGVGDTGTAAEFDGSNDKLQVADNATVSLGTDTPFTWVLWIRPAADCGDCWVLNKTDGFSAGGNEYVIAPQSGANCQLAVGNGSTGVQTVPSGADVMTKDAWNFVVFDHDPTTDTIGLRVNNGARATISWSGGTWDSPHPLAVGAYNGGSQWFKGRLARIAMWKRLLTADEITDLYNGGAGRSYADL